MFKRVRRLGRYYVLRFRRLNGDPRALALGTAMGVLVGIVPTVPFHTLMLLAAAMVLPMNFVASLISATVVCNPLTLALQYYLCYLVGDLLFPGVISWQRMRAVVALYRQDAGWDAVFTAIQDVGLDALLVLLAGGTVLAIPLAIASYYLSLRFFLRLREKRRRKHLLD